MDALQAMIDIAQECKEHGISTRGYASMAFGCPIEGDVDPMRVQDVVAGYAEVKIQENTRRVAVLIRNNFRLVWMW